MATQFAQPQLSMPLPAGHNIYNSSNQYTLYSNQQQPISPVHSVPGTPQGQSPTSPRTSFISSQARQLRPLKSPMYVPAVLRPTDRPNRKSNKSASGSSPPKGSNESIHSTDNASLTGVARTDSAKAGFGRIQENEYQAARIYGEVTGVPTQRHWKSDASAQICDAPACHQTFTLFTRRHHCRRCGNIFCDMHSAKTVRLDQDANYHPYGEYVRACDFCHIEYQDWEYVRSRSNSQDSFSSNNTSDNGTEGTATPTITCKGKLGTGLKGVFGKGGVAESLGASVSRDWNWSTF